MGNVLFFFELLWGLSTKVLLLAVDHILSIGVVKL